MALLVNRTQDLFRLIRENDGFQHMRHGEEMLAPPAVEKSAFVEEAEDVKERTERLRVRLVAVRHKYLEFDEAAGGMSDRERDDVDAEAAETIKALSQRIDLLKGAARRGGGALSAHRLGITVGLVEQLQTADAVARELRGARIRQAMEVKSKPPPAHVQQRLEDLPERNFDAQPAEPEITNQAMLQALEQENRTMHAELVETLTEVQRTEKEMMKIAALNHMLANQVSEQSRDIELLYETAVDSLRNVERGNQQVEMLGRKRFGIQLKVALFLILAALSLVLLEAIL